MKRGSFALACGLFSLTLLKTYSGEFPNDWTWDDKPEQRTSHAVREGKAMPYLNLAGWINGQVKPEDMKGKVVVVDFYATWCGPCMAAIPHNNALLEKYKDKGLVLFGVCTSGQGQEKMADVVSARGIKYPTARDPKLQSEQAWAVHYYPTYAIIDRKGIVRVIGLQPPYVEEVVKKLLAEDAGK